MKKSVFTLVTLTVLSAQSFADSCGPHNLVGEWTRQTVLASTPDAKCGETLVTETTVYTFVAVGNEVSGRGVQTSVKSFKNQKCSSISKPTKHLSATLLSSKKLSLSLGDGAQVIADCDVSSDRSKLKINGNVYH